MLVTFSCKAHSDITLFGDIALQLLTMMGKSNTIPSAMLADEVPDALAALSRAIGKQRSMPSSDDAQGDPTVSLAHRALPLIELLQAAVTHHSNVMWK